MWAEFWPTLDLDVSNEKRSLVLSSCRWRAFLFILAPSDSSCCIYLG